MAEQTNNRVDEGLGYLALVLSWLVPGLGHILIGQKARGMIFLVTLHGLFALGLLIGGIRAINPADQPIWRYTQFLTGWPMLVANHFERNVYEPQYVDLDRGERSMTAIDRLYEANRPKVQDDSQREARKAYAKSFLEKYPLFSYHPKVQDVGSVYCGLAGMLNLLVIFDVLLRITGAERVGAGGPGANRRNAAAPAAAGVMK